MNKMKTCIALLLVLSMTVSLTPLPAKAENAIETSNMIAPVTLQLTKDDLPINYRSKMIASDPYGVTSNKDWGEYSTYYYYNQLNDEEKMFYDRLMNLCLDYMTNDREVLYLQQYDVYVMPGVYYGSIDPTKAENIAYYMFQYSNPQFFFLSSWRAMYDGYIFLGVYKAFVDQTNRQNAAAQIKSALPEYEEALNHESGEYNKVRAAHDLICNNLAYNYESPQTMVSEETDFSQSIYSALVLKYTVCAGYCKLFTMICNKAGIDAIPELSNTHGWNRVSIDDIWYITDCTWDDEKSNYQFFLRNQQNILANDLKDAHTAVSCYNEYLPACTIDCTPSENDTLPGQPPEITEQTTTPMLGESYEGFTLTSETGSKIYYTLTGSDPACGQKKSQIYTEPITAGNGTILKAYAVKNPKKDSLIATWTIMNEDKPTPEPTKVVVVTPTPTLTPTKMPTPTVAPTKTPTPVPVTVTPTPSPTKTVTPTPTPIITPVPVPEEDLDPSEDPSEDKEPEEESETEEFENPDNSTTTITTTENTDGSVTVNKITEYANGYTAREVTVTEKNGIIRIQETITNEKDEIVMQYARHELSASDYQEKTITFENERETSITEHHKITNLDDSILEITKSNIPNQNYFEQRINLNADKQSGTIYEKTSDSSSTVETIYRISNNKLTLSVVDGAAEQLTIPDEITTPDGTTYPVTSITRETFSGISLKSLTLGKNITSLERTAIADQTELTDLIITGNISKNMFAKYALKGSGGKKGKNLTIRVTNKKNKKLLKQQLQKAGIQKAKIKLK